MFCRLATVSDYKSISNIHLCAFDGFFLSSLGPKFLNTYYKACLKQENTIAICACDEKGNVIGFATGCVLSKGYHRSIFFKDFFAFSFSLFKTLFTRPSAIWRLLRNLEKDVHVDDNGEYAELLSIGILPELKGKGVGKKLLYEFEKQVLGRSEKVALTTDFYDNDTVIQFYETSGYSVYYEFYTFPKRKMLKMIKLLPNT